MYENNKNIGWKKKENNNGSNYDDSLIKNQINILDEEIEEVSSQLAHIQNQNVYMYNFPKLLGEIDDLPRINRALASITDRGCVVFENKKYSISSSIEVCQDNISLVGNGAIIEISDQATSSPIFFIRKGSNSIIRDFELRSLSQNPKTNNTQGINIRFADNIVIENITFIGLTYSIKVDTDTSKVNVKNLTTNNLKCYNGTMFIHMSCCNGWQGNNLYCDLGLTNTTNLDHCYYIKPYVKNVQLSNVTCKNTNGHAIQFNRWVGSDLSTDWGVEDAINKNFVISNITVENVNSPFMFNSEVDGLLVNNLIVNATNKTDNKSHWGIVNLYQGKTKNVKINGALCKGCYCFITSSDMNLLADTIEFNNIYYDSKYKYNNVALFNVNNLVFANSIISDVNDTNETSPFMQLNNVKMKMCNCSINMGNINRTCDIIRLVSGNISLDINNLNFNITTKGELAREVQLISKTNAIIDNCVLSNIKTKNITHIYKNFTPITNFLVKDGVVQ